MGKLFGKAGYVVRQPGNGKHACHWPGCNQLVPPAMWGCRIHWAKLPKHLQDAIWAAYVPGQEVTKTPSRAYVKAARDVEQWIADRVLKSPQQPSNGELFN